MRSLTFRLTLYFAIASTAVLLGVGMLLGSRVQAHFVEQDLMEMNGKLELVRHMLSRVRSTDEYDSVRDQLTDALVGHDHLALLVISQQGRTLFSSPLQPSFPAALLRRPPETATAAVEWQHGGHAYRGIGGRADTAIPGQGPVTVAIALGVDHHRAFMAAFNTSLALALAAGTLTSAVLGWFAARGGLRPVERLARVFRGISAGRLDERVPTESMPIELVLLGHALNEMLGRLHESFTRLSHFSSDLAHELRTPISNLMLQTQVAASKARSADEYREVLYSNLEEFERLARMIGDMLFLAQADNGLVIPSRVRIDLAAELEQLFGFYEALAEEEGVSLRLEGSGAIDGDRLMVRRALGNLLSNAIRHTPRGASVHATLEPDGRGGTVLQIRNPGEIAAQHLPRLFDRFYRVDAARQSSGGGAGLGLAITQSIVDAHGGRIHAESSGGTVCLTIEWPPAAQA